MDFEMIDMFGENNTFEGDPIDENGHMDEESIRKELQNYLKREADEEETFLPKKKAKIAKLCVDDKIPNIAVVPVEKLESCIHEVALPEGSKLQPLDPPSSKPPKEYKFTLDPFQKQATLCIENNQSVLVSAHTSAGKTVVAEYAIASCLRDNKRVIYTTPIKALSNQKFNDFSKEFEDVGLITGDVTINPNASCLVMTTEILRSMLYKGSEITHEVGWVIFDEIHYMRNKERGYVWEETLILLKSTVHFVFLSATIPNAAQFAQWICYVHQQPCHIIYTEYRPVPLQHSFYPGGSNNCYVVLDNKSEFKENNFKKALEEAEKAPNTGVADKQEGKNDMLRLVKQIFSKSQLPAVIFSFSKKKCEEFAKQVFSFNMGSKAGAKAVELIFNNAIELLSEEDRALPQVTNMLPFLKRGIGIHHGGLLPIIKEVVEILFAQEYILVLFATETFAMGLNMPARTVVFTGLRKFDGNAHRYVTPSEYIQMSGRAGRRGMDKQGDVIVKLDEAVNDETVRHLLKGKTDPMNSSFHLTFNMVLNLLRVEEINPEYIIERSFFYFQHFPDVPKQQHNINECQKALENIKMEDALAVDSYYALKNDIEMMENERHDIMVKSDRILPFLRSGRLVKVKKDLDDFGWCVVTEKQEDRRKTSSKKEHIVTVVMEVAKSQVTSTDINLLKPATPTSGSTYIVCKIVVDLIWEVCSGCIPITPDLSPRFLAILMKSRNNVLKKYPEEKLTMDPVKHLKITNHKLPEVLSKLENLQNKLRQHPLHENPDRDSLLELAKEKHQRLKDLSKAEGKLKKAQSVLHMDDLKARKRVLRRLGFSNNLDIIENKGRVACTISSGDEIILTELLFNGVFTDLDEAETCALLSSFVCDDKCNRVPDVNTKLSNCFMVLQDTARRISTVYNDCRLETDENEYVGKFKPTLMKVVYDWCNGASFAEICKQTDIFAGNIVRAMKRLEELLREMSDACKVVGMDLNKKFEEGVSLIKRDIIFAPSLYL